MHLTLAVLTYNCENTIEETLNSISQLLFLDKVQLIISDDKSTDGTLKKIEAWINKNKYLFKDVLFRSAIRNEGIAANHTHTFQLATGDYGFYLGGDDLIENKNIIIQILEFIKNNPHVKIARLRVLEYYAEQNIRNDFLDDYSYLFYYEAKRQFRFLASIGYCFRSGPGFLFEINTLKQLNYFGTYNRMFEDYQLVLRFTNANYKIFFCNISGVLWRRHANQGSGNTKNMKIGQNLVRHKEILPNITKLNLIERIFYYKRNGFMLRFLYWYRDYFKKKAKQYNSIY